VELEVLEEDAEEESENKSRKEKRSSKEKSKDAEEEKAVSSEHVKLVLKKPEQEKEELDTPSSLKDIPLFTAHQ